jgi:hypothetical protein
MLGSYKLRLSDGTVLVVDHDGLSTWLVDDKAMVQLVGSIHWRPLKAFLAGERAAARNASRPEPNRAPALPLIPPPPRKEEAAGPAEPPASEPGAPLSLAEPKAVEVRHESVEPAPTELGANAAWSAETSRRLEEVLTEEPDAPVPDPVEPLFPVPAASPWSELLEAPSIAAKPSLLVLADDIAAPYARTSVQTPAPSDPLPIIRLKPLDDPGGADAAGPTADKVREGDILAAATWPDARDEKLFRTVAAFGGFLSLWLGRLDRQLGRLSSTGPEARAPRVAPTETQKVSDRPPAAGPDPHEPLKAPTPLSELPILRLADIDEPKAANDVYEGDVYEGESLIRTAWRWTKRVVVIGGLLAGGTLAAFSWETWLPKAERLSRIVFTEIDKHAQSGYEKERRQRALREAAEQLPHLAPDTIQLVLSGGVLDPPNVFRLACDAADWGLSALAPGEAQELKELRQQMLATLRPEERQRARQYEGARGPRATLPFEDRDVLELFARGARALPVASRVRLQVLSGKAIAAGLAQDSPLGARRPEAD